MATIDYHIAQARNIEHSHLYPGACHVSFCDRLKKSGKLKLNAAEKAIIAQAGRDVVVLENAKAEIDPRTADAALSKAAEAIYNAKTAEDAVAATEAMGAVRAKIDDSRKAFDALAAQVVRVDQTMIPIVERLADEIQAIAKADKERCLAVVDTLVTELGITDPAIDLLRHRLEHSYRDIENGLNQERHRCTHEAAAGNFLISLGLTVDPRNPGNGGGLRFN